MLLPRDIETLKFVHAVRLEGRRLHGRVVTELDLASVLFEEVCGAKKEEEGGAPDAGTWQSHEKKKKILDIENAASACSGKTNKHTNTSLILDPNYAFSFWVGGKIAS